MATGRWRSLRRRGFAASGALVALGTTALGLAGCAADLPASLPAGVSVSVFQNRFDYGERTLELKVSNGTTAPITVTRATFDSTRFVKTAVWGKQQEIPDGSARDLKVQLAAPACDDVTPKDRVMIAFILADGRSGVATVTPSDEQGRVDAINNEDCLAASVATIATITPPATVQWTPGAHQPASVDIAVVPTGEAGRLVIHSAQGTVLLSLADGASGQRYDLALDRVVDAQAGASVIPLQVVPARCDSHAVEEDKRGTFFPLDVQTNDGRSGKIYVAVSNEVRGSLYEFYADYCSLP